MPKGLEYLKGIFSIIQISIHVIRRVTMEKSVDIDKDFVLFISYDVAYNQFFDECGNIIQNIFEVVTPNDIFLFRRNHDNCMFPYRYDKKVMCIFTLC